MSHILSNRQKCHRPACPGDPDLSSVFWDWIARTNRAMTTGELVVGTHPLVCSSAVLPTSTPAFCRSSPRPPLSSPLSSSESRHAPDLRYTITATIAVDDFRIRHSRVNHVLSNKSRPRVLPAHTCGNFCRSGSYRLVGPRD